MTLELSRDWMMNGTEKKEELEVGGK